MRNNWLGFIGIGLFVLALGFVPLGLALRSGSPSTAPSAPVSESETKRSDRTPSPPAPVPAPVAAGTTPSRKSPAPDSPGPAPGVPAPDGAVGLAVLIDDLKAPEQERRLKAIEKIGALGSRAAAASEHLIAAMLDGDSVVRDAAAEALEKVNFKIHGPVFTLIRGMKKKDAICELGRLGAEALSAVPLMLYYHHNPDLWWNTAGDRMGPLDASNTAPDLFPVIARIAPKDKRFGAAVLAAIAAPTEPYDPGALNIPVIVGRPKRSFGYEPRVFGLAQLDGIEVDNAEKVKALIAALGDGHETVSVITAIQALGRDAAPALPHLKKLKLSPDDAVRNAAANAVRAIE